MTSHILRHASWPLRLPARMTRRIGWAGAAAALWVAYVGIFAVTTAQSPAWAMEAATANVLPLVVLCLGMHQLLTAPAPRRPLMRAARHAVFGLCFSAFWYGGIVLMLSFLRGLGGHGFALAGFHPTAFAWQSFQGVFVYALIAATRGSPAADAAAPATGRARADAKVYFLSFGRSIRPVQETDIVSIAGAQGYAEVVTAQGTRGLSRSTLDMFERDLSPRFLRLHRSVIVNPVHITRLEPQAGGRMTALMSSGETFPVSRAGAGLIRTLMA